MFPILRVLFMYRCDTILCLSWQSRGCVMVKCKRCCSSKHVKNGIVRNRQRYKCVECGCNFREGDARANPQTPAKLAACILLYSMAKGSFRMLGKLFGIDHTHLYRMIRKFGENLPEPSVSDDIHEIEFDEMRHFVGSKKTKFGSSKPLIVAQGEPLHGCSAIVILQPFNGSMTR